MRHYMVITALAFLMFISSSMTDGTQKPDDMDKIFVNNDYSVYDTQDPVIRDLVELNKKYDTLYKSMKILIPDAKDSTTKIYISDSTSRE